MFNLIETAKLAKDASYELSALSSGEKNKALTAMADALCENYTYILEENKKDCENAKDNGISDVMLDRLSLTKDRIFAMAEGVRQVASLPDPVGEVVSIKKLENGLSVGKQRVPMGTIGIIYESRPNVTADAIALCLKSGNSCILRGGKEAINSNLAITNVMKKAVSSSGITGNAMFLVEDISRETATAMMKLNQYIDVLIPRGGKNLIQTVVNTATVPVIETGVGNCHIYIDESADIDMAVNIIVNAKTSRPSVCNACESMLVHQKIAPLILPRIKSALEEKNTVIKGCELTRKYIDVIPATEEDFGTEYLDLCISCKVVSSTDEAIEHINKYGTGHSEAIVTESYSRSQKFLQRVDAAAVYVNASTRFTDGFEFGLGAEIGISTQKLHARGPMGLYELTTTKYIIYGNGQVR